MIALMRQSCVYSHIFLNSRLNQIQQAIGLSYLDCSYDYEEVSSEGATKMIAHLSEFVANPASLVSQQ